MNNYLKLSLVCLCGGAIAYALHNNWLIIRYPSYKKEIQEYYQRATTNKKKVYLSFWHHDRWHTEDKQLLWSASTGDNVMHVINSWLSLLDEYEVTDKKVALQTALVGNPNNLVYLSFDNNLFAQHHTVFEKWMLLEGLLKTIRENTIDIQQVRFLVHHRPMKDPHVDFTNAWPLSGFLEKD